MRNLIKHAIRKSARTRAGTRMLSRLASAAGFDLKDTSAPALGGFNLALSTDGRVRRLLQEIPSETSIDERLFLHKYFRSLWSGEHNVVEIGPFLGGTSRAIALGMCDNPRIRDDVRLFTFDRFSDYYTPDRLTDYLKPLVNSGALDEAVLQTVRQKGSFGEVFDQIHSGHEYARRIVRINKVVPDMPAEKQPEGGFLTFNADETVDAVFVDGCKSWFGTKYFMREICKTAVAGTRFMFQDYGWYTCFWIPVFVRIMHAYFEPLGNVSDTYAFTLRGRLSPECVETAFPDTPGDLGEAALVEVFDTIIDEAVAREDYFAAVRHRMQKAGAVAYLGNKDAARAELRSLLLVPWSAGHERIIRDALISPTYTPQGPIRLT